MNTRCRLEIGLVGRFSVRRDDREVPAGDFGGRLSRQLVRLLAIQRGSVVTRDALIEALWGDRAPADPAANLNVLVNRARHGLGDPALIETVAGGYAFRAGADVTVDAEQFADHLRSARERLARDDPSGVLEVVEAALVTWRGERRTEAADVAAPWARRRLTAARARKITSFDRCPVAGPFLASSTSTNRRWSPCLGPSHWSGFQRPQPL